MPFISVALDPYWRVDLIRHQDFKNCSVNGDFMIFFRMPENHAKLQPFAW